MMYSSSNMVKNYKKTESPRDQAIHTMGISNYGRLNGGKTEQPGLEVQIIYRRQDVIQPDGETKRESEPRKRSRRTLCLVETGSWEDVHGYFGTRRHSSSVLCFLDMGDKDANRDAGRIHWVCRVNQQSKEYGQGALDATRKQMMIEWAISMTCFFTMEARILSSQRGSEHRVIVHRETVHTMTHRTDLGRRERG